MSNGALTGVRILDFTRVLAGPFCTMLLADLGAEVIKVEHPQGGDETRHWGPPWAGDDNDRQSAYFISVNRNKRSMTLNLRTERGQALARELAAQSHVVVENFKFGGMAKFGLDYETLRADNPALVYGSITGYGQDGPYHDRPGYDYVVQAMSGLMSVTGPADGKPHKVGVAIADVITGLFMSTSVLAAIRYAEQTGTGQHVDVALLDATLAALVNVVSNYLVSETPPRRMGNQHPNIVPYQVFDASDVPVTVAVGNDRQFAALCELIARPEWATDPRYATNSARVQHREELVPMLQAIFSTQPAAYWVEQLLAAGIPTGPLNDLPAAVNDPHIVARGLIENITLANGVPTRMVGSPLTFSETPTAIRTPPPLLGQHTDEVLRDVLGMDAEAIAALHTNGVV